MEAVVEYNYTAQEPDELTLRKGDVIKEIRVMPGGWWEGTLRDKRGMFPDNFVKVLDPTPAGAEMAAVTKNEEVVMRNGGGGGSGTSCTRPVPVSGLGKGTERARRWCKVLFSYEPCNEDELTLIPQDTLEFLGEVEEGWWRGQLRGRVGVFPSNFVSPPDCEEQDKDKDKDKRELCRVIFPYDAANEDELTLADGEILTVLSKDAPDKGWWKGELRGRVGLFPDNFVEIIGSKGEHLQDQERHEDQSVATIKGGTKYSMTGKRGEKAHVRRSLDTHVIQPDGGRKSSASSSSSSGVVGVGGSGGSGDKKPAHYQQSNQLHISSAKRLVSDGNSNNSNSNGSSHVLGVVGLEEELNGVERGEGSPLFHPTASRAKAPRRRPPSTQHLRHHTTTTSATTTTTTTTTNIMDCGLANGTGVSSSERLREDDSELGSVRSRQKPPWVEELRLNQLERRKTSPADKVDKVDNKKPRNESRVTAIPDMGLKLDTEGDNGKEKEKGVMMEGGEHLPLYVPYSLYSQLLEKVAMLEEKQAMLQRTVGQLAEQLVPLLANASANNKL